MKETRLKSGFVAIVGRPNVGKSTLLNNLLGKKVAIMSDKPQTTRNKITGVFTRENMQIVFIDTPGIHKPRTKLGEVMMSHTENSLKEVDLILYMVDATAKIGKGDQYINEILKNADLPIVIALNKIDNLTEQEVLEAHVSWQKAEVTDTIIPISALNKHNLDSVVNILYDLLPEGPKYYPDDMYTDQPENMVTSEIIREKVLHLTRDEIPHSVAVTVDDMEEQENDILYIAATIYVERDSQKGIIIGKGGSMLREIGKSARLELESLFNTRVFIDIRVKVRKNWRKNEIYLRNMGFDLKGLK